MVLYILPQQEHHFWWNVNTFDDFPESMYTFHQRTRAEVGASLTRLYYFFLKNILMYNSLNWELFKLGVLIYFFLITGLRHLTLLEPLCVRIVVAFFEKHQTEGVVS